MVLSAQGCEAFSPVIHTWNFKILMPATQARVVLQGTITFARLECKMFFVVAWKRSTISLVKLSSFNKTFSTWTRAWFGKVSYFYLSCSQATLLIISFPLPNSTLPRWLLNQRSSGSPYTIHITIYPTTIDSFSFNGLSLVCLERIHNGRAAKHFSLSSRFYFCWMAKGELEKNQ